MSKSLLIGTAAVAILLSLAPGAIPQAQAANIDWSINRSSTQTDGSRVQLNIKSSWGARSNSNYSNSYRLADLQGLSLAQLASSGAPVRFALVREAGRLDCAGVAGYLAGSGSCNFTPDTAFAAYLAGRGIGRPDAYRSYMLTMSGTGRALVDALAANRYPTPTVEQLVAMGIHGVTPGYVNDLAAAGYRLNSASDLVKFRIHGVSTDYIRQLAAIGAGYRSVPADELVAFRIHGVSPELVRSYARSGDTRLQRGELTSMAIHGVTPQFIEGLAALGYRGLSAQDLVQLRIHGVTPEYIRDLQREGITLPSADQLVRLRLAGYGPRRR